MSNLVSIVIPIYNVEKYIADCVESVFAQTYTNLEIILVDDGSPDKCPQICDEYAKQDSRVKVIHKENGGLSDARNKGLEVATGDYIYFLDSDDLIDRKAIEILVETSLRNDADMVFFDCSTFCSDMKTDNNIERYSRKYNYETDSGINVISQLVNNKEFFTCVPFLFFKTESLRKSGINFYKGIIHEDGLFTVQVFLKIGVVAYAPYQLYKRRIRLDSIMTVELTDRNFHGYYIATAELIKLYNNSHKEEKNFLKSFLAKKSISVIDIYYKLKRVYRKKSEKEYDELVGLIKDNKYFENSALKNLINNSNKYMTLSYMKKPIRKLKNRLSGHQIEKIRFIRKVYGKKINSELDVLKNNKSSKRFIMMCTPIHGNLGDHAISQAQYEYLTYRYPDYNIVELPFPVCMNNLLIAKKYITKDDILIINGGGWLGTLWYRDELTIRMIIKKFKNNKIVIMPQTIFFEKTDFGEKELKITRKIYSNHKNLYLALRDKKSYDFCINNNIISKNKCMYMPDMVLLLNTDNIDKENRDDEIILCLRKDKESVLPETFRRDIEIFLRKKNIKIKYFTTVIPKVIEKKDRQKELNKALSEVAGVSCVVTDRLHCMLFCAITGTPCIAFDNISGKVSGVARWLGDKKYIQISDICEINDLYHKIQQVKNVSVEYKRDIYIEKVDEYFKIIGV